MASGHKGTHIVFGAATTIRGTSSIYGSDLRTSTGTLTFLLPTNGGGELINCIVQSSVTSGTNFQMTGSAVNTFDNLYNVDMSGSTTATMFNNWFTDAAERITFAGNPARFIAPPSGTAITMKDFAFFGTPTSSDIGWQGSTIVNHLFVRPGWSGNGPKFGFATGSLASPLLAAASREYWLFDLKIVDGTGAAISGIPIRLTDTLGNAQVDTTTDATGELSFGSGLTANGVIVMDHYSDTTQYVQRSRSPFYLEINTSNLTGYNSNYASRQYYFNWPGSETVTTTAGSFEDVNDIVNLQEPSGGQTSWAECSQP